MKIVKVTYTTTAEYAARNQENIKKVMADLRNLNDSGIRYTSSLSPDGKTFMHLAFYKSEEEQKRMNELPSFKTFVEQLRVSGPESPPKQEVLSLVGSSYEMFE